MTILKIQAFGGEVPRQPPRALPDGGADDASGWMADAADKNYVAGQLNDAGPVM